MIVITAPAGLTGHQVLSVRAPSGLPAEARERVEAALARDRLQDQALHVQVLDRRSQLRGELGRALGALPGRQQPSQRVLSNGAGTCPATCSLPA